MLYHIGYHKTATTWLQVNLFSNADLGFVPFGSLIPHTGEPPSKKDVSKVGAKYFIRHDDFRILLPFETRKEEFLGTCKSSQSSEKTTVISNERLSGHPSSGGYDAFLIASRIVDADPSAKIVICFRNQVNMITSYYFQYLKGGGRKSIKELLSETFDPRRIGFSLDHFAYDKLAQYYIEHLGSKNVLLLPYEELLETPNVFVNNIMMFAGHSYNMDQDFARFDRANAPSHSLRYSRMLARHLCPDARSREARDFSAALRANKFMYGATLHGLNAILSERYAKNQIHKIKRRVRHDIEKYFCESNVRLEGLCGKSLREKYGYP